MKDLHVLPKVRDSWSYLYVEHCRIDQDAKAIAIHDTVGKVPVPCASLTLLLLGPGTSITHAAVHTLASTGCLVGWCGEQSVRFYAAGMGETRSSQNLIRQAFLSSFPPTRLQVVKRLYSMRFQEPLEASLTLQQIRGREGVRVREAYAETSRETGVPWRGRTFRESWRDADPVNRALSTANSCLYGVCHAAIVSAGYSPGLGFIHTGKSLSFVYDVADLYKVEITIPAAFHAVAEGQEGIETRIRRICRDLFKKQRILDRIIPDLDRALDIPLPSAAPDFDVDEGLPGGLWDPDHGVVAGGINYAEEPAP